MVTLPEGQPQASQRGGDRKVDSRMGLRGGDLGEALMIWGNSRLGAAKNWGQFYQCESQ